MYPFEWNQMSLKGEVRAIGAFTYDSMGKKLRFKSNESSSINTSLDLDLLMFFEEVMDSFLNEMSQSTRNVFAPWLLNMCCCVCLCYTRQGIFYEIDSKNQSCEKKSLQSTLEPLDIPDDAKFLASMHAGSSSIEGEGLKVNIWTGSMAGMKGGRDAFEWCICLFCDKDIELILVTCIMTWTFSPF